LEVIKKVRGQGQAIWGNIIQKRDQGKKEGKAEKTSLKENGGGPEGGERDGRRPLVQRGPARARGMKSIAEAISAGPRQNSQKGRGRRA